MEVFYWPGDWIATQTSARSRRAIAAWLAIIVLFTMPLRYLFKDTIWMVWALSEAAFLLALVSIAAAETPVELDAAVDDEASS